MLFNHSFKPLRKVKIVRKGTTMRSGQDNGSWGPSKSIEIWEAFQYALCDGVEKLDTRGEVMFDLSEQKLREKCARHGFAVVN